MRAIALAGTHRVPRQDAFDSDGALADWWVAGAWNLYSDIRSGLLEAGYCVTFNEI
jgi:hypothetical protein